MGWRAVSEGLLLGLVGIGENFFRIVPDDAGGRRL